MLCLTGLHYFYRIIAIIPFPLKKYKDLSIVTRWLIVLLAIKLLLNLTLRLFHTPDYIPATTASNSVSYTQTIKGDSWGPMVTALQYIKENPNDVVYHALLINKIEKFQYPPSSLLIFDLPQRITGWSYTKIASILDRISWLCVILMGLITARMLELLLRENKLEGFKTSSVYERVALYFIITLLVFIFYPIRMSYNLGQIQTILTFLGIAALFSWQSKRKALTGILIGLICLVKPQLGLLFIWAIIRREWKMVIAGSAVVVVFLLLSISIYGFNNHLDYLSALSFLSHHGEAYYANQSMNGLMNRLLFNGDNLRFNKLEFPPYLAIVYITTLLSSLIFILSGLLWNYKSKSPDILDLGIMILCATIASPIAWEHHYGILISLFIFCIPFILHFYQGQKWIFFLFTLAFLLTAQNIEVTNWLADTKMNILQSYFFFGSCLALILLFMSSNQLRISKPKAGKVS